MRCCAPVATLIHVKLLHHAAPVASECRGSCLRLDSKTWEMGRSCVSGVHGAPGLQQQAIRYGLPTALCEADLDMQTSVLS